MKKRFIVKKMVSKIVFAGLLISPFSAMPLVKAQELPEMQPTFLPVQPKLSKAEVDKKIKTIKKTVTILKTANVIVPLALAATAGLTLTVSLLLTKKFIPKFIEQVSKRMAGGFASAEGGIPVHESITPIEWARLIPLLVALGIFVSAPLAIAFTSFGIYGTNIFVSLAMLRELKQAEKEYPGTLSNEQRRVLIQLEKWIKYPVIKGIIKYFALKKALKETVVATMKKDSMLLTKIKKARTSIAHYIKLKWQEETAKKGLAQSLRELNDKQQKNAKKFIANLEKKIKELVAKNPYLEQSPELKNAIQEFGQKASELLEEFKKPVLEKKPRPVVPFKPVLL